ncbi:MAG: YolD-like family protein [Bacilli bacterium]|jgi:hypothetical protein|nr:YolD-like family protein [Bacilli bacterium]
MRGMKKWLPFKSLNGQEEVLNQMEEERRAVSRPILGEDEIEELNRSLLSLAQGDRVRVTYYRDHSIEKREGYFVRASRSEGRLYMIGFNLPFGWLLGIQTI